MADFVDVEVRCWWLWVLVLELELVRWLSELFQCHMRSIFVLGKRQPGSQAARQHCGDIKEDGKGFLNGRVFERAT